MTNKIELVKPKTDENSYDYFKLDNGLSCITVHDKNADKSAVCLSVNLGFFHNPKEISGLAHFLEHMLFMGTKSYPDVKSYVDFILTHNGSRNGVTSSEHTRFYHEINNSDFAESLNRFSEFFKDPLIKKECVDSELNIVHSEYEKGIPSDSMKIYYVHKHLSKSESPFSHFSCGSKETLKRDDIHEQVLKFFQKFYSGKNMCLVLLGRESLCELKQYAEKYFGAIPSGKEKISNQIFFSPFNPSKMLHKSINIVPSRQLRYIQFHFWSPFSRENFSSDLSGIVTELIGHEGLGSLYLHLKNMGWCSSLISGSSKYSSMIKIECKIVLTQKGEDHIEEMILLFFEYIRMLKDLNEDEVKRLFDEFKKINNIAFNFKNKSREVSYVSSICSNLRNVMYLPNGPKNVLKLGYRYFDFSIKSYRSYFEHINVDNMIFLHVSKKHEKEAVLEEPLYHGKYYTKKISSNIIEKSRKILNESNFKSKFFHPPPNNNYIAKQLPIPLNDFVDDSPIVVYKKQNIIAYHTKSNFFRPKSALFFRLTVLEAHKSCVAFLMLGMISDLIQDSLNDELYLARLAKLRYSLYKTDKGLFFQFYGFSEKLPLLIARVFKELRTLEIKKKRFDVLYEERIRRLENMRKQNIVDVAADEAYYALNAESLFTWEDQLSIKHLVTFESTKEFFNNVFVKNSNSLDIIALSGGSLEKNAVIEIMKNVESILGLHERPEILESEKPKNRICKLPMKKKCILHMKTLNLDNQNITILKQVQIGLGNERHKVIRDVLKMIMKPLFFDQLRTKELLGYSVHCYPMTFHNVMYYRFYVVSDNKPPSFVLKRINKFCYEEFLKKLKEWKEEKFIGCLKALKKRYEQKWKNVNSLIDFYWDEISSKTFKYGRWKELAKVTEKLGKSDVVEFYEKYFTEENETSFSVGIFSEKFFNDFEKTQKEKEGKSEIRIKRSDVKDFSSTLFTFPQFHNY